MRIGAVIAAAGAPGGFRSYDELEHTDGSSMIRRMIYSFRRAGVEDIAVVTGYKAEETEKTLAKLGAVFLRTENYETEQMLDFAARGFRYLAGNCSRIFFCPADVPLFTERTLKKMMEQDAPAVIPAYEGRRGHPVLLDSRLTEWIASYRGERGLKGAIDASGEETVFVEVSDGGVVIRARKEDCFEEVAEKECPPPVYPRVKVQLVKNEPFFGPGMMVILKQIEILGSVRIDGSGVAGTAAVSAASVAARTASAALLRRRSGGSAFRRGNFSGGGNDRRFGSFRNFL